ncbi:MAG: hypothetical protein AAF581_02055 [Planctomycetota bacterium]
MNPRILIAQDVKRSFEYQAGEFAKAAEAHGLEVQTQWFDIRKPAAELIASLKRGAWFDWLVTDLLGPGEDLDQDSWKSCTGMGLLQEIAAAELFGGYGPRGERPKGVRCVAVASVLTDHSCVHNPELREALSALGVDVQWTARGGDLSQIADRICERLRLEQETA